jgi:uncharacterized protein YneF (UPF0154 family)
MQDLLFVVLIVGVAILVFVICLRVGILLGLHLDRAIEARAAEQSVAAHEPGQTEEASADE